MRLPLAAWTVVALAGGSPAAEPTGAELYKAQCARCHGAEGQGSKKYKEVLAGNNSVAQLAKVVKETMPEEDPGSLTDAEAARIAEFMHGAFYSADARERNAPPRVELARLTVDQFRYTVADLVLSFRGPFPAPDLGGLRGEYYPGRRPDDKKRKLDRTDPAVAFDFGTAAPDAKLDAAEFNARWTGSVVPPETGEYEFVVKSDQAVKLWVNDEKTPLIDALVKSGPETEFRGSAHLTAGRPVRVRLEFSKAKQGVNDKKKLAGVPAFVRLEWKAPHRPIEVIPARHLGKQRVPDQFTVTAPFPPDDRSRGWVRGTTVNKAWDQATTDAALETAAYVVDKLDGLAGTDPKAGDRADKVRRFARTFAERAFRRPLTDAEAAVYIDRHFAAGVPLDAAVRRVVILTLKSPRFLYRELGGNPADGYAVAARLSYTLWDSLPDDALRDAAAKGELATPEQVRKQAERMAADPRAGVKLAAFVRHWLHLDGDRDLAKSKDKFPQFDPATAADLRTSLDLFTAEVLAAPDADFRKLLLADEVYVNARLAKLYGATPPKDGFQKVKLDAGQRAGVLTHPYLLSAFAYTAETSPIHRGVFLARSILGVTLKPPQEAFTPLAAALHPTLTTRERVLLQTQGANCQTCHAVINPLGFSLEQFDAIGKRRDADNSKPVDAVGHYLARDGQQVEFRGPRELAAFLAASPEVHTAFSEKLFHHLVQQPVRAYGADRHQKLREAFAAGEFNVRKLAVEAAVTAARTPRSGTTVVRADGR